MERWKEDEGAEERGRSYSTSVWLCGVATRAGRYLQKWPPPASSLSSTPPPLVLKSCHILELGPRLGGLVDVTLVQWALVACLLAQCLMELELQHEAHKVPAGTDGHRRNVGN